MGRSEMMGLEQKIREKLSQRPTLQWFDGEVTHSNYPNIGEYVQALDSYVNDLSTFLLGLVSDTKKTLQDKAKTIEQILKEYGIDVFLPPFNDRAIWVKLSDVVGDEK